MSVSPHKPHVFVLPEDDANRQIANGLNGHYRVDQRRIRVMPPLGGWRKVLDTFKEEYLAKMQSNVKTHVVMLIDFDGHVKDRRAEFESDIPKDVRDRVFVVGARNEAENIKSSLKRIGYEDIGAALAKDCADNTTTTWSSKQLQHNAREHTRMIATLRPFVFPNECTS